MQSYHNFDELHEYALVMNEELERIRDTHKTNEVRINFSKDGDFLGFLIKGEPSRKPYYIIEEKSS